MSNEQKQNMPQPDTMPMAFAPQPENAPFQNANPAPVHPMQMQNFYQPISIEELKNIQEKYKPSRTEGTPSWQCQNLTKSFTGGIVALNDISFDMPAGKIIGLLGANGSGKTTLMKIAAGLLQPTQGQMYIYGKEPSADTKRIVSYLPERTYFSNWMSVKDITDMLNDFYADFDRNKATEMLLRLGIDPTRKIKTLSKGTKEKVQLAMVMSRNAKLYLLDEPIAGVDPAARDFILNTIISNYHESATVVISTHLIWDIEKVLDEVVFIANGQLFLQADVEQIRADDGKSVDALFREVFRC